MAGVPGFSSERTGTGRVFLGEGASAASRSGFELPTTLSMDFLQKHLLSTIAARPILRSEEVMRSPHWEQLTMSLPRTSTSWQGSWGRPRSRIALRNLFERARPSVQSREGERACLLFEDLQAGDGRHVQ
jgi:hypothetical protein